MELENLEERYNKLLETLTIEDIFENEIHGKVDRDDFVRLLIEKEESDVEDETELEIYEGMAWRTHGEEYFDVKCEYDVIADNPMDKRKKLFEFTVEICALYHSRVEMTGELFDLFESNVRLNLWPYVREHIHDLSRRMNISDVILAPRKIESDDVEKQDIIDD